MLCDPNTQNIEPIWRFISGGTFTGGDIQSSWLHRIVHATMVAAIPISSLVRNGGTAAANDVNGDPRLWPNFQCVSYDTQIDGEWVRRKEREQCLSVSMTMVEQKPT